MNFTMMHGSTNIKYDVSVMRWTPY